MARIPVIYALCAPIFFTFAHQSFEVRPEVLRRAVRTFQPGLGASRLYILSLLALHMSCCLFHWPVNPNVIIANLHLLLLDRFGSWAAEKLVYFTAPGLSTQKTGPTDEDFTVCPSCFLSFAMHFILTCSVLIFILHDRIMPSKVSLTATVFIHLSLLKLQQQRKCSQKFWSSQKRNTVDSIFKEPPSDFNLISDESEKWNSGSLCT